MPTLIADIETDGLLPDLTRVWCIAIVDDETGEGRVYADAPGYTPISHGLSRLAVADRVVMHNGLAFDFIALQRLYPGTLRLEQVYDTLVVSRLVDPQTRSHSLEAWGEKLGRQKVVHEDWSQFSTEMAHRCLEDTHIGRAVYHALKPTADTWGYSVELEHRVRWAVALQELNGFRLDVPSAVELAAELRQEVSDIEKELHETFKPRWVARKGSSVIFPGIGNVAAAIKVPKVGNVKGKSPYVKGCPYTPVELLAFNPGSRQHIENWLRMEGWKPRIFTPSGHAQLDDKIIRNVAVMFPKAEPLARYFEVMKMLGQINDGDSGWLRLVRGEGPNARVYGSVKTNGTVTGRMSHNRPNMAQVSKRDMRMRAVWCARPGWKLVDCDAEALELRMLAHFLAPYDGGELVRVAITGSSKDGTDIHTRNQRLVGLHNRDSAKTLLYALIYGAGNDKLGLTVIEDAVAAGKPKPKGSPAALGRAAREALEKGIFGLDKLTAAAKRAHSGRGFMNGLDGRRIVTRGEHSALNTLLQSGGALVCKKALEIFHYDLAVSAGLVSSDFLTTKGFGYVANVHDEVCMESEPEIAEMIGKLFADAFRLAGEYFNLRVPMSGAYAIGDNWAEVH